MTPRELLLELALQNILAAGEWFEGHPNEPDAYRDEVETQARAALAPLQSAEAADDGAAFRARMPTSRPVIKGVR